MNGLAIEHASGLGRDKCHVWWAALAHRARWHTLLLDQAESERHRKYLRPADRDRFTVGVALSRIVLGAQLGIPPAAVAIDRTCARCGGPHGRPRLAVGARLDFSIAHSGEVIALAVTGSKDGEGESRRVGLDVEMINAAFADEAPVDIVLSAAEYSAYSKVDAARQASAFVRYWVRKEALLKATGDGLGVPMTDLTVSAYDQPPRLIDWQGRPGFAARVLMHDLQARPGYAAAVALVGRDAVVISHDATEILTCASSVLA